MKTDLEIISLVNIPVRGEEVVHYKKVDFLPPRQLDPVQPVEPTQQRMWVRQNVLVVMFQDRPQEFVFGVSDGLDDEFIISTEVEERTRFAGRA